MMKLNSFSDLETPIGLFPVESNFILDSLAIRSTNLLAGLSIEDINETLIEARQLLRTWGHMNCYIEWNNSYNENKSNKKFRFAPPETENTNQNLSLEALVGLTTNDKEHFLSEELSKNSTVAEALRKDKKTQGGVALYYYLLAIKVAQQINRHNTTENNSYYRLGKVSRYLYSAEFSLTMMDLVDREINAITQKEMQLVIKHKKHSSKGGKAKFKKHGVLKEKVFHLYDEINSKFTKISNSKASKLILNELKKEISETLRTEDPAHTIEKWIGDHKRNQKGS